jgi:hypothetical protein
LSVVTDILKPTVSLIFLLELTAGLKLGGLLPVSSAVTSSQDWGSVASASTVSSDWGSVASTATVTQDWGLLDYTGVYYIAASYEVSDVRMNGVSMTAQTSPETVYSAVGSGWYSDDSTIYLKPAGGRSVYANAFTAIVNFYFASKPKSFNNHFYEPLILTVPNLSLRIEPRFSSVGQIGTGTATLINNAGYFDAQDLCWDAGRATFKMGTDTASTMAYASYQTIGTWRVASTKKNQTQFELSLRELKTGLEKQIPLETYSRDDYPNMAQGDVGKPIPRAYGKIFGAKPVLIDPATKTFKVAGHAIKSFDAVRVQKDEVWLEVPFASTDLSAATFTLGSSWENESVSVDFYGRKNTDGTLMVNASDIVEDLLSYVGETNLDSASFDAAWTALDIGSQQEFYRRTLLKPSLYLSDHKTALEVIGQINQVVGSFLFNDLSGAWHYEVFTPAQGFTETSVGLEDWGSVASAAVNLVDWGSVASTATVMVDWGTLTLPTAIKSFDTSDILDGSYSREEDDSQIYSKIIVKHNIRKQDGWHESVTVNVSDVPYDHGEPSTILKELEAPLWDGSDATYYAQRLATTEAMPLVKHRCKIPWQAFFILPGDNLKVTFSRFGLASVLEALEVKYDLIKGAVELVLGDRRAWGDSFGWWTGDTQHSWSASDSSATKLLNKQTSGFWHGDDLLAISTDAASYKVSRWW